MRMKHVVSVEAAAGYGTSELNFHFCSCNKINAIEIELASKKKIRDDEMEI